MSRCGLNCTVAADFTVDPIKQGLEHIQDIESVSIAPFNQIQQILHNPNHEVWSKKIDVLLLWTRPEAIIKSFAKALRFEDVTEEEILDEVREFSSQLINALDKVSLIVFPSWVLSPYKRGQGVYNLNANTGVSFLLMKMNLLLSEALKNHKNIYLLDTTRWLIMSEQDAFHPKYWYMGKMLFGESVFSSASEDISTILQVHFGSPKKLLVLDLDDTLWGGIVGDIGWQNIILGGHHPIGEAFYDFQLALKSLKNKGIMLAIASKNEESLALNAIQSHPEMVLKIDDFVAWRINWKDKAENIKSLANELNILTDSIVFIDDNPAERERVKQALPEVYVPDWPLDKTCYVKALSLLGCFDSLNLTLEDNQRTNFYINESKRQKSKTTMQSFDDWLKHLNIRMLVNKYSEENANRVTQLLNKTNQMNLKTRRLSRNQLENWLENSKNYFLVFDISDEYGHYGIAGVCSLSVHEKHAELIDFVLSCRVFGRKIENSMLAEAITLSRSLGVTNIIATLEKTEKNKPTISFFEDESGMECIAPNVYQWDLRNKYTSPNHIFVNNVNNLLET